MKKLSIKIIFTVGMIWMAAAGMLYAGADIAVEEPVFLFGSVTEGTQVTHDFIISNPGDDVLSILRVVTSCGCTVADYPKTIAPGKTGIIHVKADTSGYGGRSFKRQLVIRTDAPGEESVRLQIEGIVK
ncbi:OS_HP2 family (seleno)protein [Desulfobacter sp.]|uniref:OS_HP2 family (seleno)protein n=1 Tax=Desulfobacter sp. TaxID=2294 RepID=UPI003D0E167D